MRSRLRNKIGRNSVKEAIENMPMGICFFDKEGYVVLSNRQMFRLMFQMGDKDLQLQSDLEDVLENPKKVICLEPMVYQLPDGTVWQFMKKEIQSRSGQFFLEVLANEITELYKKREELSYMNRIRKETISELERLEEYIGESTREKEILRMKMDIHSALGDGLRSIHHYLEGEQTEAERKELLNQHRHIARILLGEADQSNEVDSWQEFCRVSERLGCSLIMEGKLPQKGRNRSLLISVLRECRTNMIRHAKGRCLYFILKEEKGLLTAKIFNDGKPPEEEVQEGGGLSALRRQIEEVGGSMRIQSYPLYVLTVILPN